jgi:hypothetical protein
VWDLCEHVARYVDKVEFSFHILRHVVCVACQFLPDIFFKGCPVPSAHLLDLGIGVSAEG